jgi:hypothetical protein
MRNIQTIALVSNSGIIMRITRYTTIVDHRCNIDGALNHVDGNIDMIVYKVDGPRSNFWGISSASPMGIPKYTETE